MKTVMLQMRPFDQRGLKNLQNEYSGQRNATISMFESLQPETLAMRGVASNCSFSVNALAYIIAGHERHHLNILNERYFV